MYSSSAIFSTLSWCWGLLSNVMPCYFVTEFLPYVFQVLSLLLEIRQDEIPAPYMELFPLLLAPVLWERNGNTTVTSVWNFLRLITMHTLIMRVWSESGIQDIWSTEWILQLTIVNIKYTNSGPLALISGNIPPLVRLLQAYIEKGSKRIIETKKEVRIILSR